MSESTGFVVAACCVILSIAAVSMYGTYQDNLTQQEAIKAGLVQKLDTYGRILWVEKETKCSVKN